MGLPKAAGTARATGAIALFLCIAPVALKRFRRPWVYQKLYCQVICSYVGTNNRLLVHMVCTNIRFQKIHCREYTIVMPNSNSDPWKPGDKNSSSSSMPFEGLSGFVFWRFYRVILSIKYKWVFCWFITPTLSQYRIFALDAPANVLSDEIFCHMHRIQKVCHQNELGPYVGPK